MLKSYFGKTNYFYTSTPLSCILNQILRDRSSIKKAFQTVHSLMLQEEHLYKYPISTYSADVDEITNQVEPFYRLFNIVLKWQKAEKKYGSQYLMELSICKSNFNVTLFILDF